MTSYLDLLRRDQLPFKTLREHPEKQYHEQPIAKSAVGQLFTVNSVYRRDLVRAQYDLYDYFNRSLHRPFNCLLLGPPGSGKSFIAKQLADFPNRDDLKQKLGAVGIKETIEETETRGLQPAKENKPSRPRFFEYNLSQLHRPDELSDIFREIANAASEKKIVLLDEFDVRIGSSSVIRYLIEPMYDGKISNGKASKAELGKTAFIFSGSYLADKNLLKRVQKEKSQIDVPKFLFECFYRSTSNKRETGNDEIYPLLHMCDVYRRYQEEMTPERDTTLYLRQLDKLSDFLSRINGFVIEVPNLSAPFEITDPPEALLGSTFSFADENPKCSKGSNVAEKLIEWVEVEANLRAVKTATVRTLSQRFAHYATSFGFEPILQYKDMLLKERLHVFLTMFDNERKNRREKKEPRDFMRWTNDTRVWMKRSLLNYLCTAPLVHGMRSLNTLMWNLEAEEGRPEDVVRERSNRPSEWDQKGREQYTITLGDPEKVARHVRKEGDYQDPLTLWTLVMKRNGLQIEDEYIDIILDGDDGSLRVWDLKWKTEADGSEQSPTASA
jgi:hypothetical protein